MLRIDVNVFEQLIDNTIVLSEGSKKAIQIMQELMARNNVMGLCSLDSMNIRGDQIVVAYDEWAGGDYIKFAQALRVGDPNI